MSTFKSGEIGEELVRAYFGDDIYTRVPREQYPYDGRLLKDGELLRVEIKYNTLLTRGEFPAEIHQDTHFPQTEQFLSDYLKESSQVDLFITINAHTQTAYVYDCHQLRAYVLANKSRAVVSRGLMSEPLILWLPWECKEAGYQGSFSLKGVTPKPKLPNVYVKANVLPARMKSWQLNRPGPNTKTDTKQNPLSTNYQLRQGKTPEVHTAEQLFGKFNPAKRSII